MEYKEYLDNLNTIEKQYVANFFKRKEYIENINQTAIDNCNDIIISGKGNCNSKIIIISEHYKDLDIVTKFIKPIFESINTSLWNVYFTSIIKSDNSDTSLWNQMIQHEINAVSPSFGFIFINNKESFIEEDYSVFNKTFPVVYINMDDINYVLNKDNFKTERYIDILNKFYKYVLNIIQYREIEISE